jgi:ABC-type dipeptide/oligopeptide/nickel transport system permease subunit
MSEAEALELEIGVRPDAAIAHRRRSGLRRLASQRSAKIGVAILVSLVAMAVLAEVISPWNPTLPMLGIEPDARVRAPPCIHALGCPPEQSQHLMGLDGNARDVFSRVVFGSRVSLFVGFVTVGGAIFIGMVLGGLAGFVGGRTDNLLMRLMDIVLAFPALLLALVIVTALADVTAIDRLQKAMLAVAIVGIPVYARVMRSSVLAVRQQDYVVAAQALGDSQLNILRRRVLPNSITPLIVAGTLGIGTAVIEIAALSFLGLAAVDPTPEWGLMIGRERSQMFAAPHLILFPGIFLTLTVLGFNLLGDGLRDALDPRLHR